VTVPPGAELGTAAELRTGAEAGSVVSAGVVGSVEPTGIGMGVYGNVLSDVSSDTNDMSLASGQPTAGREVVFPKS
jgi:hypothetical protein